MPYRNTPLQQTWPGLVKRKRGSVLRGMSVKPLGCGPRPTTSIANGRSSEPRSSRRKRRDRRPRYPTGRA